MSNRKIAQYSAAVGLAFVVLFAVLFDWWPPTSGEVVFLLIVFVVFSGVIGRQMRRERRDEIEEDLHRRLRR